MASILSKNKIAYQKLENIIKQRQLFESSNQTGIKTDINYPDVDGNTLLCYAAAMGDLDLLQECINQGAEINFTAPLPLSYSPRAATPIEHALKNDHVEVANFLYEKGATLFKTRLTICKNEKTKLWFLTKLQEAIKHAYAEYSKRAGLESIQNNQFFKVETKETQYFTHTQLKSLGRLSRAAELGNFKLIQEIISEEQLPSNGVCEGDSESILNIASTLGQFEIVQWLVGNHVVINPKGYNKSPLHAAVEGEQSHIVRYLLESKADVNALDSSKNTPLILAIKGKNLDLIKILLSYKPSLLLKNIDSNTVFHLVATISDKEILEELFKYHSTDVLNVKNAYGFMPLDIAIQYKNDAFIELFSPTTNLNKIKNLEQYGAIPIPIPQASLNRKLYYYLLTKRRDTSLFSTEGNCDGLSFLYNLAESENDYFDLLKTIMDWDDNESSLSKPIQSKGEYAAKDDNLDELFNQFINDLIWFQNHTLENIVTFKQNDRQAQYKVVSSGKKVLRSLYSESFNKTPEQIKELLSYYARMPQKTSIEFGDNRHAVSSKKTEDNIRYYDPNMPYQIAKTNDPIEIFSHIENYKYILLGNYQGIMKISIHIFHLDEPIPKKSEKADSNPNDNRTSSTSLSAKSSYGEYEILTLEQLPKNNKEAEIFQNSSPNQFTPLHIAVIFRSTVTLNKLIAAGNCDLQAVDKEKRKTLDIAIDNGYIDGAVILLDAALKIDAANSNQILNEFICKLYQSPLRLHTYDFIKKYELTNIVKLMFLAIKNGDLQLIEFLCENKLIDNMNCLNQNITLLMTAINTKTDNQEKIISYLLKKGADATIGNAKESPLSMIISSNETLFPLILGNLKNINKLDSTGNAAIHHAAAECKPGILKMLLAQAEIDVVLSNAKKESPLTILKPGGIIMPFFGDEQRESNRKKCIDLLMSFSHNKDNTTTVGFQLSDSSKIYQ